MDEYVEMLVAAGWITSGDVDDEYQQYIKRGSQHEFDADGSYEDWQRWGKEWDELNEQYKKLEAEHPDLWDGWTHPQRYEAQCLLDDMLRLENYRRY